MNLKTGLASYKKTALAFGGIYSAFECFFAVFLFTYMRILVPAYVAALIVGLTLTASVAVMPAVYAFIRWGQTSVLGRFHGALLVSTLFGALSFFVLFTVPPEASLAYKVSVSTVMLLLLGVASQTFSYCNYAIGVRVTDRRDRYVPMMENALKVVSATAVVGMMYYYFDYTSVGIGRMAAIVGVLMLVAGCCVYFSTYTLIPRLIVDERRRFRPLEEYRRMFGIKKSVKISYIGRYFGMTAVLIACLSAVTVTGVLWRLPAAGVGAALSTAALSGAAIKIIFFRGPAEPAHYRLFSIGGCVLIVFGVAGAVLPAAFVTLDHTYAYTVLCVGAGLCGIGYALFGVAFTGYMEHAYSIGGMTRGRHKCLKGMTTMGSVSSAVVLLAVFDALAGLWGGNMLLAALLVGSVALFCIIGAVLSVKGEQLAHIQTR